MHTVPSYAGSPLHFCAVDVANKGYWGQASTVRLHGVLM